MRVSYHNKVRPLVDKSRWLLTGVAALDYLAGRGLPKGSVVQLYGAPGSRKSTAALVMLKAAQEAGYVTVYYNIEAGFLDQIAMRLGIDFDPPTQKLEDGSEVEIDDVSFRLAAGRAIKISKPGFVFVESYEVNTVEDLFLHATRVCAACEHNGFSPFFVADSMTSLTTRQEQSKQFFGDVMMEIPKSTRKGYRLFQKPLVQCGGIFVAIDHKKPTGLAGSGSAPAFYATTRLDFTAQSTQSNAQGRPIWFCAEVEATKSRHAASIRVPFAFSYEAFRNKDGNVIRSFGVDRSTDLMWFGPHAGLFSHKASGWLQMADNFPDAQKVYRNTEDFDIYASALGKYPAWVDAQIDLYYVRRWWEWCADAGVDADEFLRKYGDDVYKRVQDDIAKALRDAGLEELPKAVVLPTLSDAVNDFVDGVDDSGAAEEAFASEFVAEDVEVSTSFDQDTDAELLGSGESPESTLPKKRAPKTRATTKNAKRVHAGRSRTGKS